MDGKKKTLLFAHENRKLKTENNIQLRQKKICTFIYYALIHRLLETKQIRTGR